MLVRIAVVVLIRESEIVIAVAVWTAAYKSLAQVMPAVSLLLALTQTARR